MALENVAALNRKSSTASSVLPPTHLLSRNRYKEMSDPENSSELKAGHPPAVKAGGMRVAQHKPPKAESSAAASEPDAGEESTEQQVVEQGKAGAVFISGVESKGNKDFPPEAIKSYHEKPHPTHDKRPHPHTPNMNNIQQPGRKQ